MNDNKLTWSAWCAPIPPANNLRCGAPPTQPVGERLINCVCVHLVEQWLSILVRKLLRRGNFTSPDDLRNKVLAFIAYFNRTMAKPFKWTYQGKPLRV